MSLAYKLAKLFGGSAKKILPDAFLTDALRDRAKEIISDPTHIEAGELTLRIESLGIRQPKEHAINADYIAAQIHKNQEIISAFEQAIKSGQLHDAFIGLKHLSGYYGGSRNGGIPMNLSEEMEKKGFSKDIVDTVKRMTSEQEKMRNTTRFPLHDKMVATFVERYPEVVLNELSGPNIERKSVLERHFG